MKKRTYLLAVIVFFIGVFMLLGTSYSLVTGSLTSKETYGFNVANFSVEFQDNAKITITGVPTDDYDALKNSKEFTFSVTNNSDYDVNYRLDILENSATNMSNVIHYAYSINDSEYSDVISLEDNYTIKQNKVLEVNSVDTYKVKMWLSIDADESYMNKKFSANISLLATQNEYKYATTVIEKLAKEEKDGLKKDNDNYRYTSNSSLNYIWFNCQEGFTSGKDYCEKWRILGSIVNDKENAMDSFSMLKIVNTDYVNKVAFNKETLMGDYDQSNVELYANNTYYEKLTSSAKKLVLKAKWNIGEVKSDNYDEVIKEEDSKHFYGYIGLPNVSDYLYLKNDVFLETDNTLLMNKTSDNVNVLNPGLISSKSTDEYNMLPCIYLRPDVSIMAGDGSSDNPYELGIKYPMNY